jgi:hypothetical protein
MENRLEFRRETEYLILHYISRSKEKTMPPVKKSDTLKTTAFTLPPDLIRELRQYAESIDRTASWIVREALTSYLQRVKKK